MASYSLEQYISSDQCSYAHLATAVLGSIPTHLERHEVGVDPIRPRPTMTLYNNDVTCFDIMCSRRFIKKNMTRKSILEDYSRTGSENYHLLHNYCTENHCCVKHRKVEVMKGVK